jgi:phage terminase large subunit
MPTDFDKKKYGVDFGFNHPTAVIDVGFKGKNLYIDELFYQSECTNADVIKYLNEYHPDLKKRKGAFEWAEPDRLEEFKRAGYDVTRAKKDVFDGISKVKEYNLFVTKRSVNTIKELQGYVWKEDKFGKAMDEPINICDDAMAALRYAVFTDNDNLGILDFYKAKMDNK